MVRSRVRRYFRHGFLPQLIAFEACVRQGSVTLAAEELALAQPTVSGLLRKLSETVGGPILRPHRGRMEPTPLGRELLALCEGMLDLLELFDSGRQAVLQRELHQGGHVREPQLLHQAAAVGLDGFR